jgi:hypothetical protein
MKFILIIKLIFHIITLKEMEINIYFIINSISNILRTNF